ncbi:P-loop containing nucleoside triphosphate hydrolase protein [Truncatella angustata]|uniref:P-loop containing nucleoside triphosphate hydrolase protein n=1 Tax=Truncatella angustata TaxID=152316 RepID=A0A9P8RFS8_9PEZI|nr:P-loop containing nucleoside triphosphate hydrolase protein [Truncatella angustata]KAH6645218.1 P-loop containing nucleoside triphosphate hydrolase protein [Truncatella angustata]
MYLLQVISALCSISFLSLVPFRLWRLHTEKIKIVLEHRSHAKMIISVLLLVLQLIVLIVAISPTSQFNVGLFSVTASFVACIGLCPLLFLEHTRSIRPSDLAVVYLLVSLVCDATELLTVLYQNGIPLALLPAAASLCVKLVLLVAESQGKEAILRGPYDQQPPEQLAGILNRTFFWWINPVLAHGSRNVLTGDSLPSIDEKLSSTLLRHHALQAWDRRAKPERNTTLPQVLVLSMLPDFLAPIVPRLSLITFRYAQPVLISTVIRYISKASDENSKTGYLVILMAVIVYVGLAISKAVYQHRLNRLKVMIRGAVVGLINNKSLNQQSSNYNDGKAVTLMSTDAENVGGGAQMFHETWAQTIEVVVGTVMLAREVGWVCPVPLVIIFFCSRMSRYLAKTLQNKQKNWNLATQKRLAMTTSMLSSMKSLKMLGVTTYTESLVQSLRLRELDMAKKVRWMMVAYNASANALGIFSPIVTFVLFVLLARLNGSVLDTETAFTTTALLGLVTHPANMIMSIVPEAIGSLAAFERIQQYLLQPPRHDQRLFPKEIPSGSSKVLPAICLEDVIIQTSTSAAPLLRSVNLVMNRGDIVICSGPMGSGKSTLAKAIMGELPTASGTISVSSKRIAYCAQSPWLPSGTFKKAICGFLPEDASWYEEVVRLCCLEDDLLDLPDGDHTMIGSRGINLSGGQRQRVALARAVYSRCEIVLLDDSFSALDGRTESQIMENLIGPGGLFKKKGITVLLVTNSATYFHMADWLVVLGDASIKYQGPWAGLTQKVEHVLKVHASEKCNTNVKEQLHVDGAIRNQRLKVADAISDLNRATGDISLYGYYLKAVGFRNFLLLVACTSSYSFFVTFPQYWLERWTAAPPSQTMFYVGGYLISSLLAWAFTNGSMWSTYILIAPESGAELHRRLLSTIIGAPLSYFSVTDTGVILNRFSQDIQLVDRQLPPAILSILNQVFKLLVQTTLLFSAQKIMSLTLPLCVATVYLVQRVYLRTSRQIRLLDLESQSAVYSSFLESVEGVATVRAFGWKKQIENLNIEFLDKSQQPSYILFCLQRWLNIVLDLMVATIATSLITLAVLMKGSTTAGQIGMALNIVLVANTTLLGLVTSWTNMEISLGAMSRLKSLEAEMPKEDKPYEDYIPVETWPSSGVVEFDDVTVAYSPELLALQNVTLKVPAGQQLVICGRTGSGKSTLLLTLLRLLDMKSGSIKIDGVDLSLVPRSLIRQRCFITVAQDSFIIDQASLRFNLDPSSSLLDDTIIAALERTCLWSHFQSANIISPKKAHQILNSSITSLPEMSTGQAQLFGLARAILQLEFINSVPRLSGKDPSDGHIMPILLLDEATSSLDPETESAIHKIIHQEFTEKGYTVITITHRLSGVTENMRHNQGMVALLSKGKVERTGVVEDILSTILSVK